MDWIKIIIDVWLAGFVIFMLLTGSGSFFGEP